MRLSAISGFKKLSALADDVRHAANHAGSNAVATALQGDMMADDKTNTGGGDRKRINVNEDYELHDWSKKFNVTPEKLKEAVQAVGTSAEAVEKHLKSGSGN